MLKVRVYYGQFVGTDKCYVVSIKKGNKERFLTYNDRDTGRKRIRAYKTRRAAEAVARDIIMYRSAA